MKIQKGQFHYIKSQKMKYLLGTISEFSVVIILVIVGYVQTGTRLNWFTLFAVLACLPSAKMLVELITLLPIKGVEEDVYREIELKAPLLTKAYDLVITCNDKNIPVDAMVISDHVVCGYTVSERTDESKCADCLKAFLKSNHYDKMTVKIFHDYHAFLSRAEGMNNIAEVGKQEKDRNTERIKQLILSQSM